MRFAPPQPGTMPISTSGQRHARLRAVVRRCGSGRRARAPCRRPCRSRGSSRASGKAAPRSCRRPRCRGVVKAIACSALEIVVNSSMSAPAAKPLSLAERMASPLGGIAARWSAMRPSSCSTSRRKGVRRAAGAVEPRARRGCRASTVELPVLEVHVLLFRSSVRRRPLEPASRRPAAADAKRRDGAPAAGALEHLERVQHDARAGGADGVADGDGAAVDVELAAVEPPEGAVEPEMRLAVVVALPRGEAAQHLRGEGLVHLDRVDVVPAEAVALHHRRDRVHRPQPHLRGVERAPVRVDDAARGASSRIRCTTSSAASDEHRRAVGDLRAVARGHVAVGAVEDGLQLRELLDARVAPQRRRRRRTPLPSGP